MGLLDANTAQMFSSETSFGAQAALLRSTITSAEQEAMATQAFHQGESQMAFQASHAHFVDAAVKINFLLDTAQANIGQGATTYVAQDGAGASDIMGTIGALPATTNI